MTESALVGNVIDVVVGLGVLPMDASDLHMELVCDSLEVLLVLTELGKVDMD